MRTLSLDRRVSQRTLWKPTFPPWDNAADKVWWRGNTLSKGTTVTVTGSQTLTEVPGNFPRLDVSNIASVSANDLNTVLFPRTISVGQVWRCWVRVQTSSNNQFLMGALMFADGVTSAANFAGNVLYYNTNGTFICQGFTGTLTAASPLTSAVSLGDGTMKRAGFILELEYAAVNTFSQRIYGADGVTAIFAQTGWAATLTPTHVGVAWSNWGNTPTTPSVHFGPIYRHA